MLNSLQQPSVTYNTLDSANIGNFSFYGSAFCDVFLVKMDSMFKRYNYMTMQLYLTFVQNNPSQYLFVQSSNGSNKIVCAICSNLTTKTLNQLEILHENSKTEFVKKLQNI